MRKETVPSPRQREQLGGELQYKDPNRIDVKDQKHFCFNHVHLKEQQLDSGGDTTSPLIPRLVKPLMRLAFNFSKGARESA